MTAQTITDADITAAAEAVHRFLTGRLRDQHQVDDVCQEAVARLLRARDRLDPASATPYAMTVAKSLVVADARRADVARRHSHRLGGGPPPPSPEDLALQRAEAAAVTAALHALPADERHDLLAHVVEGEPTSVLAARSSGTPGGVAARLARTRARMRVDYLVASRGSRLPSARCHPILVALSAGDRRRQRSLGTAEHLIDCEACAALAPPLVERQRSLVGLLPIPALAALLGKVRHRATPTNLALSSVGAVAVTVAVIVGVSATSPSRPAHRAAHRTTQSTQSTRSTLQLRTTPPPASSLAPPPSPPPSPLQFDGQPASSILQADTARAHTGRPATAMRALVLSVPADEGFWVSDGAGRRVWAQLRSSGESDIHITRDAHVSFTGVLVAHGPGYPEAVGVSASEGAAELARMGFHIDVDPATVVLGPR